jgi:hypothetical protein
MEHRIIKQIPQTQEVPSGPNGAPKEQTSKEAATAFYKRLTRRAGIRGLLSRLANK